MSSTESTVTVLYPASTKFDMDYYLKTHMPLVSERWGSFGLKAWYVSDLRGVPDQLYSVQATLVWDAPEGGLEGFKKAGEAHGPEVMGDVKNFSTEAPIIVSGGVVAQWRK